MEFFVNWFQGDINFELWTAREEIAEISAMYLIFVNCIHVNIEVFGDRNFCVEVIFELWAFLVGFRDAKIWFNQIRRYLDIRGLIAMVMKILDFQAFEVDLRSPEILILVNWILNLSKAKVEY